MKYSSFASLLLGFLLISSLSGVQSRYTPRLLQESAQQATPQGSNEQPAQQEVEPQPVVEPEVTPQEEKTEPVVSSNESEPVIEEPVQVETQEQPNEVAQEPEAQEPEDDKAEIEEAQETPEQIEEQPQEDVQPQPEEVKVEDDVQPEIENGEEQAEEVSSGQENGEQNEGANETENNESEAEIEDGPEEVGEVEVVIEENGEIEIENVEDNGEIDSVDGPNFEEQVEGEDQGFDIFYDEEENVESWPVEQGEGALEQGEEGVVVVDDEPESQEQGEFDQGEENGETVLLEPVIEDLGEEQVIDVQPENQEGENTEEEDTGESDSEGNNADSEDPFDAPVSFSNVIANGTLLTQTVGTCGVVALPQNYKKIDADITFGANIKSVMMTEKKISDCQTIKTLQCPTDAQMCQIQQVSDGLSFSTSFGSCVQNIYMYFERENLEQNSTIDVAATFVNNTPCADIQPNTTEVQCASTSPFLCENHDACIDDCIWAKCSIDIDQQVTYLGGYCVPSNFSRSQVQSRCNSLKKFSEVDEEEQLISMKTCSAEKREEVQNRLHGFEIFLIVIGCLFAACCCCSCYYRYSIAKNKTAPFEPPKYCPESFFPRTRNDYQQPNYPHRELNETLEMQNSSYKPPDLYNE